MTATARQEREMKAKYDKVKNDKSDVPPLDRLRAYILSKGVRSLKMLSQNFKRIDQDKNGKIDFEEFRDCLKREGIVCEVAMQRECFDAIDTDHSGSLNFDEFILVMRPPMSNARKSLILQAYQKLDRDGSGEVTASDLKGVYDGKKHKKYISGEWTEEQVLQEWLRSFNGPGKPFTGEITLEDFENYYAGVSASIDTDAYFDLMMRQAWKL